MPDRMTNKIFEYKIFVSVSDIMPEYVSDRMPHSRMSETKYAR